MTRSFFSVVTLLILSTFNVSAQSLQATTDEGRKVLLNADGTWQFVDQTQATNDGTQQSFKRPSTSTSMFRTKSGNLSLWYDPTKWKLQDQSDPTRITFQQADGDVLATIIPERFYMTMDALRALVLRNAQNVDPNAVVTGEQNIVVNGVNLLSLKIKGTIQGISFVYYGYFYAGKAGSIQVITFTSANLFDQYTQLMQDFLNGTVVNEQN